MDLASLKGIFFFLQVGDCIHQRFFEQIIHSKRDSVGQLAPVCGPYLALGPGFGHPWFNWLAGEIGRQTKSSRYDMSLQWIKKVYLVQSATLADLALTLINSSSVSALSWSASRWIRSLFLEHWEYTLDMKPVHFMSSRYSVLVKGSKFPTFPLHYSRINNMQCLNNRTIDRFQPHQPCHDT